MPGCGMHSRRKLAEKARYDKPTQNKINKKKLELLADDLTEIISGMAIHAFLYEYLIIC